MKSIIQVSPGVPLYREVKRRITESVRHGEWPPGGAIPSESKLCERFGVSMGTIRKAVDELSAEGFLIRQQGRGTFVASHNQDRYLFAFFHVARQDGYKEYPKVDLVEFEKTRGDTTAAAMLRTEPGARMVRFVNKLELSGAPVVIDEILLPESLFPRLTEKRLRDRPATLYQLYQEDFRVTVIRTEERLRAIKADAFKARLLGMKVGEPLLQVIRVALSFKDQPVELRYSYVDTRRHEYYSAPMAAS
ncbi:MAG: GntR family transcriptional regulator [Betaproteobacteria bacterium]|nr:GntR family transcriptional regulator [Betaproteobacteria bacterium]